MKYFVSAVDPDAFDTFWSLLKSEDHWMINFHLQHEETYTVSWRSLLMIGKVDQAFLLLNKDLRSLALTIC